MELGWSALWFIVAVSLLVTIHEYGHFWVARKLGFKVLRFSVGFGKPLFKKIGGAPDYTEYVIAAVPLGGYVRMLDERDGTVSPEDLPRAFASKEPWKRILVMLAGPAANIVFAILLLWGMVWYTGVTYHKPLVGDVTLQTPAAAADLRSGDEFLSIDGDTTRDHGDVMLGLLDAVSADGTAAIDVRGRDGAIRHLTLSVPDPDLRHKLTEPQALIHGLGFEFWRPLSPAKIGRVTEGKPAALAGLKPGDVVRAANGTTLRSYKDLYTFVAGQATCRFASRPRTSWTMARRSAAYI
jgi:regulator of sigma E protease